MSITETTRPAVHTSASMDTASAGPESLSGHSMVDTQACYAAEGQDSPQAIAETTPIILSPAGSKNSRSHAANDPHTAGAAADNHPPAQARGSSASTADAPGPADTLNDFPGGHGLHDAQPCIAAGDQDPVPATLAEPPIVQPPVRDQTPPAATPFAPSISLSLLADPLLALAADVLGDLEKVRIANENRLRQLTRSVEDSDGEVRGFGLDEAHPDVARLAALVGMLGDAEHKATLNLQRVMRKHPLGPWMAAQKGIGEKQGARLLASIGDPYIRPEITREDGTVEPSRPRLVSELWAYAGYHVIRTPVSGHTAVDTQRDIAAGGELNGSGPGQNQIDGHTSLAGVAPKRQRGQHANWSAAAKMRAYLVAEKCVQAGKGDNTPYYQLYAATKAKYAEALHAAECVRCGPKGKPAQPGSPLSDGHKHARALRAVAKEVLKNLWREARRIHLEASAGDQAPDATHQPPVTSGSDHLA